MRAGTTAVARLIEVSRVGVSGKSHGASVVDDAIVWVCGDIFKKLVHGMGGGLGGRGLLGTNGTEGDEEFVVDRKAVPQEGSDDALDAFDAPIVKRRAGIGICSLLSIGAIRYGGMLVRIELGIGGQRIVVTS